MSACVEENLLETGSIPPRSGSVEEAVAGMGKAATLAEWVYAGLRVETRDWSAELRKSAEVTLPKFAMLESSVENTGSIAAHSSAETAGPMRGTVTTVGVSGPAHFGLDQMVAGVRDAKVMGGEGHAAGIAVQHVGQQMQAVVATSSSFMADIAKPAPVVVEEPVVAAPVVEVVAPAPVVVETPVVAAPVVEVVAPAPVAVETPVVAAPVVEVVAPAPVVVEEPVVAAPVVEVVAPAPVVIETPVVAAPVVEVVAPAPVVIEAPVVAAPVVEVVAPVPVVIEAPVVAAPVVEVVVPSPVVVEAPVVAAPVVEVVAPAPVVVETPVVAAPVVEVVVPAPVVVEAPVVEVVAPAPVVIEAPVVAAPVVEVVVPAPVVVETPVVEVVAPAPVVVEEPVVAAPVVEVVAPAPVAVETPVVEVVAPAPVVIEAPVVAAPVVEVVVPAPVVVETPVVEVVAPAPVVVEEPVVAAPVVEVVAPAPVVIEAPVVAAPVVEVVVPASVVVEPVVEAAAPVEALRTYIHEFTPAHEMIRIDAAFGHDFADLLTKAVIYMNEESTVIELNDGSDMVILTHFQMTDLKPEMLSFDADGSSKFTIETPVIETPISPEATADVFDFSLNAGRVYVNGFDQGVDTIFIHSDLFNNYAELLERTNIYQDGTSTVIELHNGDDMIILPHFSMKELNAGMFTFEAEQFLGATAIELGTAGDDTMIFGTGDQTIDPGQGFDVVTGGVGNDTFIFNATSGHDFIVDFHAGEDHIQIGSDLAHDFDDMMSHASIYQDGTTTQIEFAGGQLITLYNTDSGEASAKWFTFA